MNKIVLLTALELAIMKMYNLEPNEIHEVLSIDEYMQVQLETLTEKAKHIVDEKYKDKEL